MNHFTAMAEGNDGESPMEQEANLGDDSMDQTENHTAEYNALLNYGLDERVASKLDEIYRTGMLAHADLDERALDALKEFPVDGALNVLTQFMDSNLEHVSNKSAFLCGIMKTYRQRNRAGQAAQIPTTAKPPDENRIREILNRTGYRLDVTTGQRKYGGPPPNWDGAAPGNGCEVFCGKIPRDLYEDELIPLFEQAGTIWDLRLMMDPMTGQNRGYAFITYTDRDAAERAVLHLDNYEIKPGKKLKVNVSVPNLRLFVGNIPKSRGKEEILEEFRKLTGKVSRRDGELICSGIEQWYLKIYKHRRIFTVGESLFAQKLAFVLFSQTLNDSEIRRGKRIGVTISYNNHRLFVGNIPKNRDRDELFEEFAKHAPGLIEVIIYSSPDDKKKNRGFCFLEYENHKAASLAKRRLCTSRAKVWNCDILVDWADPLEEPDEETMSKVKVLYVRNLTQDCTEENLKESFESYGKVERVKKIKDYAFVHFEDRDQAIQAMLALNASDVYGSRIEVSLAKPPSDKKKKEEMLRARERRLMQMMVQRGGGMIPPMAAPRPSGRGGANTGSMRGAMGRGDYDYDYDYDYYGYGDYRGGYSDPYYDDFYRYEDYYYDYALPPPTARGRARQPQPTGRMRGIQRGRPGGPMSREARGVAVRAGRGVEVRGGRGVEIQGPRGAGFKGGTGGAGAVGRGGNTNNSNNSGGRGATIKRATAGKRKFDGGHQNQGDSKRRFPSPGGSGGSATGSSWGSQPIPQQPLSIAGGVNGSNYCSPGGNGGGDQQWYQDSYGQSWS